MPFPGGVVVSLVASANAFTWIFFGGVGGASERALKKLCVVFDLSEIMTDSPF